MLEKTRKGVVFIMKNARKIYLKKMTVEGFKGFQSPVTFEFDRICTVVGDNDCGKTSIGEAIAYVLTGGTLFGEIKNIDALINKNSNRMRVEIEYIDESGGHHKLARNRSGNTTTITLDDAPIRQVDVEKIWGDRNTILSIINPLYFIERLAENGGREFLIQLLPPVDDDTVMSALGEYRKVLKGENLPDPMYYIKKRREEKRKLEEEAIYTKAKIDSLTDQIETIEKSIENAVNVDSINNRIEELYKALKSIDEERPTATDISALLQQKAKLEAEKKMLKTIKPMTPDITLLERRKNDILTRMKEVAEKQYIPKKDEVAKLEGKLENMREEYKKNYKIINRIKAGQKCPSCLQVITSEHEGRVKNAVKKQLGEIEKEANEIKVQVNKLLQQEQTEKEKYEQEKAKTLAALQAELNGIKAQIERILNGINNHEKETATKIAYIDKKINEITEEIEQIKAADKAKLEEFEKYSQKRKHEIFAEVEKLQQAKINLESLEAMKKEIEKETKYLEYLEKEIKQLEMRIDAAAEFAAKKAELILKPLQMNRVKIELYDVIKSTGEIKNTFKFTYLDREYRLLSLSQRIKAGLEISEAIRRITGYSYPVFVDNSESVSVIDNVNIDEGQYIFAVMETGRQQLKVVPGWYRKTDNRDNRQEEKKQEVA